MNKIKELWNKNKLMFVVYSVGIVVSLYGLIKAFTPKKTETPITTIQQPSLTKSIIDSLTNRYIILSNETDKLKAKTLAYQTQIETYQIQNSLLKQELLKRRTLNESKINYIESNASIEATLDTITNIISRNPIKNQNR